MLCFYLLFVVGELDVKIVSAVIVLVKLELRRLFGKLVAHRAYLSFYLRKESGVILELSLIHIYKTAAVPLDLGDTAPSVFTVTVALMLLFSMNNTDPFCYRRNYFFAPSACLIRIIS